MFNAFYEALTDIRNYHRRFTAVEAPEVGARAGAQASPRDTG